MRAQRTFAALFAMFLAAGSAHAVTSNTARIVRNVTTVLDNVQVDEALVRGPVAEKDRQRASNLLRDMDYALQRANGDLGRVSAEDKGDSEVEALQKRAADLAVKRESLSKALSSSQAAGAALDGEYRAFREDAKPYRDALTIFPESSGSSVRASNVSAERLVAAIKELAALDRICTSKYSNIQFNDRLAFQLAINPITVCQTAAKRQELATAMVQAMVKKDLAMWERMIDESRTNIAKNDGLVGIAGNIGDDLMYDRPKGKATILEKHKPYLDAIGAPVPPELFAGIDKALDALWAEVERLAPTYSFPTAVFHDGVEAGAKKALLAIMKGASIQKSAMLFSDWEIAKNNLGIPTERYRTGAILFKTPKFKWCQYRQFTAHMEYAGAGQYAAPKYTFGGTRYQQCK